MPYTKQYTKAVEKVNGKDAWEDLPSKETPITAQCLDTIEQGVATNDERIVEMSQIYDKTAINMGRKSDTFGGTNSVAAGYDVAASGNYSSAVGHMSKAEGLAAHAEGRGTAASYDYAHAEGNETIANGEAAHAEGYKTTASGYYSHAEGQNTKATRMYGHAEGNSSESSGSSAHAEGESTVASGDYAHAEGSTTTASSSGAHAEGYKTVASNINTHAEGCETTASGSYAHAEGYSTKASGASAHAEGSSTEAQGECSHVEGWGTVASPGSRQAHAEGLCTIASGNNQHVEGKYNVEDTDSKYAHIVGGGTADDNRKNIFTVDWNGNVEVAGDVENGNGVSLDGLKTIAEGLVPNTRTIAGVDLKDDVTAAEMKTALGYTASDIGLGNADDTSDMNKPVSTAQQTAIDAAYANSNAYTDQKIADLIDGAPETMDTLKEVAEAIQENKDVETALNEAIGKKANQAELDTHTSNSTIHITSEERTKWNGAVTDKHTHSNKSVLDATTASYTTEEKEKLKGIEEGAKAPTAMTGATADADGTSGLVPAPLKGEQDKFLRADGTWVAPPESTLEETDPTVPDWAKQPTKPVYTAADVGAEPEGTVYDLIGVKKASDGEIRSRYVLYDRLRDMKEIKDYYGKLADMIYTMSNGVANAMEDICKGWTPNRKSYSIGYATAADSVLITDNGIITLRIYKISNDQLMAVNQYVYVSDTYGDNSTFVGKLAANTGALSNTYGTIAASTADKAVKVTSVKGYLIKITVMECLY